MGVGKESELEPKELKPGKIGFQGQEVWPGTIFWMDRKKRERDFNEVHAGVYIKETLMKYMQRKLFLLRIYFMGSYNENISLSFQIDNDIQQ